MLLNLELTNYVCIILIIILAIQLFLKLHTKDSVKFNLSSIFWTKFNDILERYFNKLIIFNKKMSVFYIWLILGILLVGLYSSLYGLHDISNNLESYVNVYYKLKGK